MPDFDMATLHHPERLEMLQRLAILDSPPEPAFDRLTRLAARLLRAPIALIVFVDHERQFFKSCIGLSDDIGDETPLSHSICQYVVVSGKPLMIEDALTHPLTANNPLIGRELRSYAGVPLILAGEIVLGSLCVIDAVRRIWTDDDIAALQDLAAGVMTELELRSDLRRRNEIEAQLRTNESSYQMLYDQYRAIVNTVKDVIFQSDADGAWTFLNPAWTEITGFAHEESIGRDVMEFVHPDDRMEMWRKFGLLVAGDLDVCRCEMRLLTHDGGVRWVEGHARRMLGPDGAVAGVAGTLHDLTERKLAEAEQARLASFPELNPHPIIETDLDGAIIYLNPVAQIDFPDLVTQGADHVLLKSIRALYQSGQYDAQAEQVHELVYNDRIYEYQISCFPGQQYLRTYVRDVTKHKQAEAERDRFFALSMDMLGIAGFDGYFKRLNPAFERTLGFSAEEMLAEPFINFLHPDDLPGALAELEQVIMGGKSISFESRCRCKDGSYKWIHWTSTPFPDQKLLYGTARDITARKQVEAELQRAHSELEQRVAERTQKLMQSNARLQQEIQERQQAEAALRESEQRFRLLAENSTDMISRQSYDGIYYYVSPACKSQLGYQPEELLGHCSYELFHPSDLAQTDVLREGGPTQSNVYTICHRMRHRSGRYIWFESILRMIWDEQAGAVREIQAATRNITERKEVEEALKAERTLLARRVAERTMELSAANLELAHAARLKDEFLANMSHELRTPLNAVLGLSEAMQEEIYGEINSQQFKALQGIAESGRHLLALINDILDLSKIEAGKLDLNLDIVEIEPVCQASLRLIKQVAQQKRLRVFASIGSETPPLIADERRLKQILVNLLSNAVKFTPEEGTIGLEVLSDEAKQVIGICVWDTGIGIAEENLARLFQPFAQLDSSLARQYAGTGLGLALVSRMVDLHGGRVSVESEVGKGSRFTVWLPWRDVNDWTRQALASDQIDVLAASVAAPAPMLAAAPATAPDAPAATDARPADAAAAPLIILAEDNEDNIAMLVDYLRSKHYRVIVARNGYEAVAQAKATRPALILMDIQMPGMDGLEATRSIRADAELDHMPIIALTALAMQGDRERCIAAGVDDYLSKPVKLQQLANTIATHLHSRFTKKEKPA